MWNMYMKDFWEIRSHPEVFFEKVFVKNLHKIHRKEPTVDQFLEHLQESLVHVLMTPHI